MTKAELQQNRKPRLALSETRAQTQIGLQGGFAIECAVPRLPAGSDIVLWAIPRFHRSDNLGMRLPLLLCRPLGGEAQP